MTFSPPGKAVCRKRFAESAQKRLNDLRAGVLIASVNIETVTPPAEAADAFRDVASARADSSRIVNEAHGYSNDIVPRARGEARQMIEAAEGHKQRVINLALGDTERFRQVAAEYAKASEVNGRRLYMETLEQVLPRIRKVFVDKNGNLDLTILRKRRAEMKPTERRNCDAVLIAALGGLVALEARSLRTSRRAAPSAATGHDLRNARCRARRQSAEVSRKRTRERWRLHYAAPPPRSARRVS